MSSLSTEKYDTLGQQIVKNKYRNKTNEYFKFFIGLVERTAIVLCFHIFLSIVPHNENYVVKIYTRKNKLNSKGGYVLHIRKVQMKPSREKRFKLTIVISICLVLLFGFLFYQGSNARDIYLVLAILSVFIPYYVQKPHKIKEHIVGFFVWLYDIVSSQDTKKDPPKDPVIRREIEAQCQSCELGIGSRLNCPFRDDPPRNCRKYKSKW